MNYLEIEKVIGREILDRKYVEFAEKEIGIPIGIVSYGPARDDIIYRNTK